MDIPQVLIDDIVQNEVGAGDIYKITMSLTDGITLKDGYKTRDKYFVVLGFDPQGNVYGGIVFNSKINQNLPPIIKQYHMPVSAKDYPFLSYDSFLNCSQLMITTSTRLMQGEKVGTMNINDFELIRRTVCSYPNAVPYELKRFGLI